MFYTQYLKELTQDKIKMLHLEFWNFFTQTANSDHCAPPQKKSGNYL
jgi:hypothetical protein